MSTLMNRMLGAARLDVATYEEVEHDRSATGQAALVVVLASVAAGIGALAGGGGIRFLLLVTVAALIGWLIWAAVIWFVGTKLLPQRQTEADIGQLLRTMGFAAAPGVLRIFEIIPLLGGLVALIVYIWMLVTMVVAVRQALDYDNTWRAVGVCLVGWIIQMLFIWMIGGLTGMGNSASMS